METVAGKERGILRDLRFVRPAQGLCWSSAAVSAGMAADMEIGGRGGGLHEVEIQRSHPDLDIIMEYNWVNFLQYK